MPTGADNNTILEQDGAEARGLQIFPKLHTAAGLVIALGWIAVVAVVFRQLPTLDGLYDRLIVPFLMAALLFLLKAPPINRGSANGRWPAWYL